MTNVMDAENILAEPESLDEMPETVVPFEGTTTFIEGTGFTDGVRWSAQQWQDYFKKNPSHEVTIGPDGNAIARYRVKYNIDGESGEQVTVRRRRGSVLERLEEGPDRQKVLDLFDAGEGMVNISKIMNVKPAWTSVFLKSEGRVLKKGRRASTEPKEPKPVREGPPGKKGKVRTTKLEATPEEIVEIFSLFDSGEMKPVMDLAKRFNLQPTYISNLIKESGRKFTRAKRAEGASSNLKPRARTTLVELSDELKDEAARRFKAGEGLVALATEHNVSPPLMREWLVERGCVITRGRKAKATMEVIDLGPVVQEAEAGMAVS